VALAEAMAAGTAVVTTEIGGTEHLIQDGETGFRVPPRDPVALAGALTRLRQTPELRHQMGAAARRQAELRFSQAAAAEKHYALYQSLV
jgi:glycosyltransferase involved in cell wall biosynthesis